MINNITIVYSLFFILTLVCFGIYLAKVNGARSKKWKLVLYLVVTAILIALINILGKFEYTDLPIWVFIAAQAWLLLLGILHVWLFEKWIDLENNNFSSILFTFAVCFLGYGLLTLSFKWISDSSFPIYYFYPAFFFIAPTFVRIAFAYFMRIPIKHYKAWTLPAPGTLTDPTNKEMANPIIVNFEISREITDSKTVFKAKAPQGMNLGKLFYFFISDYNSKNPNSPIVIINEDNKTEQWSFYQTNNLFKSKTHLDPDITISENKIKENSSVICKRISI